MEEKYKYFIQKAQGSVPNTLMEWMKIDFVEAGENYLIVSMPVDKKFYQPFGILHGGIFSVLAETVASAARVSLCISRFKRHAGIGAFNLTT